MIALTRERWRRRRARSRAPAKGPRGPLHGIPLRHQGQLRDRRHADHRRVGGAGRVSDPAATRSGGEAARRRRRDPRQDQPARTGGRHHHDQLAGRADPQPLRSRCARLAGRAAARPPRWRRASRWREWPATPAGRSGSPPPTTTCSACAAPLGLSSRTGIIPLSHTQDIGGPLARTVTDLALLLDATVGDDPADAITPAGDRRPQELPRRPVGGCPQGHAHRRAEEPVRRRAGRR